MLDGSDDAPYQARGKSDEEARRPQPTRRSRRATAGKRKSWAEDDLPGRDSYDDGTFTPLTTTAPWFLHCSVSFCSCRAFGSGDDLHFDCAQTRRTITFRKPRRARGRRRLSARSSRPPSVPLPTQVPSEEAPISKSSESVSLQLYRSAEEASAAELRRLLSAGMSRPLSKTMTARPSSTLRPVRHAVNIIVRGRSVCDGLAAVCLCRTVARRLQGVQGKYGRRDERAKQRRPCASEVDAEMLVLCRLGA